MDYSGIRRLSLRLFIGFLVLTALVAIVSLVSGEFGETQAKILGTTFTISVASICCMSCAAFIDRRKETGAGLPGILLAVAAAVLVIVGIWAELQGDRFWKTTTAIGVSALALAHSSLLLLPDLGARLKWVQRGALFFIGVLAAQIIAAVWMEIESEAFYRGLGAVAVVVGLGTLVIPILVKMRKGEASPATGLVLERVDGDVYRDPTGRRFEVRELETDEGEPGGPAA